jgi:hypothetical protein
MAAPANKAIKKTFPFGMATFLSFAQFTARFGCKLYRRKTSHSRIVSAL